MNIFDWIAYLFLKPTDKNVLFTGVVDDPRSQTDIDGDWSHSERVVTAPIDSFHNPQILQSPYPYEDQQRTSSCVSHGVGLALAIERVADISKPYTRVSWIFNYRLRKNYPMQGCYMQNVFDNYRKIGAPLYTTLPDVRFEDQANDVVPSPQMYNEAEIFKGYSYFTVTSKFNDIRTLADIASQGHGVPILVYAQSEEWGVDYPYIKYPTLTHADAEIVHCVCILPNSGFTKDGKRYVTIQDSAHFGAKTLRHLSEDFVKARVYAAAYWDKVVALGTGPVPKYHFARSLTVGSTGIDVMTLQKLFISQGTLPTDMASGFFGGKTLAALHAFQTRYADEILTPNGLSSPTDLFGPASIAVANRLCIN